MKKYSRSTRTRLNKTFDRTAFIGRENEYRDIQKLIAQPECRLLTLTGPGGIGKTRLALQLGTMISDNFADGAFVAQLQPLDSSEFFAIAIADALGVSLTGQDPPLVQLGHYLSTREVLIILDNFEHLLSASNQLSNLLLSTPNVKYLITSREALKLQEEWLYPVHGLSFPTESDSITSQHSYDAVKLFNERAQRIYSDFSSVDEAESVIRICQLVGGMPLALELAAGWRKTMDCEGIADEIRNNLDFLTSRLRNLPERHHSIQIVFNQTWQRLIEKEQDVFKRLSVFRGGFQQDAVVAVTGVSLSILSSLVDKSLLQLDTNGRYQIHELLRQYAAEQLEKSAVDVDQAQADHADYYIKFLHQLSEDVCGGRQREAFLEIKAELDNIRAAWIWSVTQGDALALQKGSEALGLYYQCQGGYLEGMSLFSQATEVLQAQEQNEARDYALLGTLMYQGWYHLRFGNQEGTESCMEQSHAIYRRLNIPPIPGYLTDPNAPISFVALTRADYTKAIHYAEQVRQQAEKQKHPINRQFAYHLLAEAYQGLGNYETAQKFAQQAYAQSLLTGDRWFRAYILNNMGQIAIATATATAMSNNLMGQSHFQSSYEIRQAFNDPEGMALALINLGNIAFKERSFTEAEDHYRRSYAIYQDINDKGGLAAAYQGLGMVLYEQGDYVRAKDTFRQALQLAVEIDYRPILFGLLVNIAELLWTVGQREQPMKLLAFTIHNPTTNYQTQKKAQRLLMDDYQNMVSAQQFLEAIAKGEANTLDSLTAEMLYQLSIPLVIVEEEQQTSISPESSQNNKLIEPLTPRELEVLKLLCDGMTNQEVANKLVISIGTVKFYTNQIYGKLGARNRVTAVARAHELKLINDE